MKYETLKIIYKNRKRILYDADNGTGTDQTTDTTTQNPNKFLAPLASSEGIYSLVMFLAALVVLIYVSLLLAKELKIKTS